MALKSTEESGDSVKARAYLEQIEKWDAVIRNKFIEKEQWLEMATGIVAHLDGERVQSSGSQQRMADATDRCIDIDRQIDELKAKKAEVIATIELLPLDDIDIAYIRLFPCIQRTTDNGHPANLGG